ncbi:Methyltransferase domain [Geosmithia morbida]|uniref:Methyltransferase domain n=1 Tax=Geosmithia morbida TaxID=1094350 RepID=A0A9P4YPH4_9HYPO|nr:Methyltransferase domain [Geosmithia morbida]KAF4120330.1 Methyltransferase domain [Geosmithia morbida]
MSSSSQTAIDGYHWLCSEILQYHLRTGGKRDLALDVLCGQGLTIEALLSYFRRCVGIDTHENILEYRLLPVYANDLVTLAQSTPELLGTDQSEYAPQSTVKEGTVDLITLMRDTREINMDQFWHRAAEVLRPGGTVAFLTLSHPVVSIEGEGGYPAAIGINTALERLFEGQHLRQYVEFSHAHTFLYTDTEMPWGLYAPEHAFERQCYFKQTDVAPDNPPNVDHPGGELTVRQFMNLVEDMIAVRRWRRDNILKCATERDVIWQFKSLLTTIMNRCGRSTMTVTRKKVLVMVKKKHR